MDRALRAEEETLAGPLEHLLPEWSPVGALPSGMQGLLEVVRAEALPSGEGTLLVCYAQEVGMMGLLVKSRVYLPGIEQAHVRIGEGARVRLVEPPEALKRRHGIRGLVVLREGDPFPLRRDLISLRA